MTNWNIGIDESGAFGSRDRDSFVGAVVTCQSKNALISLYKKAYRRCGFGENTPDDLKTLLNPFHFSASDEHQGMNEEQRNILVNIFLPAANHVLVSTGRPPLIANQQHWWLHALETVLLDFVSLLNIAKPGDSVNIEIDPRSKKALGIFDETNSLSSNEYHKKLCRDVKDRLTKACNNKINISCDFKSDSCSPLVNFADIICGLYRKKMLSTTISLYKFPCHALSIEQALGKITKDLAGLTRLFGKLVDENADEDVKEKYREKLSEIVSALADNRDEYRAAWEIIHTFYKELLEQRGTRSNAIACLRLLKPIAIKESDTPRFQQQHSTAEQLEILEPFFTLDTHLGKTKSAIAQRYQDLLKQDTKGRITERWERHVRFFVHKAQLAFNAYRFHQVIDEISLLWEIQEKISGDISTGFEREKNKQAQDKTTAEILGTLGQAHAFEGNLDNALEYLELDYEAEESEASRKKVASYLFSVHHHRRDIKKCREWFSKQSGHKAEDFAQSEERKNTWFLLSYQRLRALELKEQGSSQLANLTDEDWLKCGLDHPWPLTIKWGAFCAILESDTKFSAKLLRHIVDAPLQEQPFTLKTLSLPIYQILATLLDSKGTQGLSKKYQALYQDLCKEEGFAQYVEKRAPWLKTLQTENKDTHTLWKIATSLPFNYS